MPTPSLTVTTSERRPTGENPVDGRTAAELSPLEPDPTQPAPAWPTPRRNDRPADIPDEVGFATKPRLAMAMTERAVTARVRFGWVTADEAYGQAKYLRFWLEQHDIAHVLAIRVNDTLITTDLRQPALTS